jgi:phage terminase small subunit
MAVLKNPKHELFAQELVKGQSAAEAYKLAGYGGDARSAETSGPRLFRNVQVQERVQELQARVADSVVVSRQWVIERLVENANRAMQAAAPLDGQGQPIGDFKYDGSVANRALELLGKELGMFVERKEVTTTRRFVARVPEKALSVEEWQKKYTQPTSH